MNKILLIGCTAMLTASAPAAATTIDLTLDPARYTFTSYDASGNPIANNLARVADGIYQNNDVTFYTASVAFDLPTGFTNGLLTLSGFVVDDRGVAVLNDNIFAATGLYAAPTGTVGSFFFGPTGSAVPLTFVDASVFSSAGLVAGTNVLTFIVNNTNNGIYSDSRSRGPSTLGANVRVSVDTVAAAVPEPASWAMMIGGISLAGGVLRRRRAGTRTTVSFA